MFFAELNEIRNTRHRAVVIDDFAQDTRREHPRHASKVYGRLGMPGALEHTTFGIAKRKDVTGTSEISGPGCGINQCLNRCGTVSGRDTG